MFRQRVLLICALWAAFLLRVWGLDLGLPYEFHPDEHYYIEPVLNWYAGKPFDIGFISPPLFTYVLAAGYWFWLWVTPLSASLDQWLTTTWIFARFVSVIFSMLAVALAYPTAKRLYGNGVGVIAVLILSGLFLPAREAHFAVNDSAVGLFVLLAVYTSVALFWRRRWQDFLVAGIAVGAAALSKLTGGFAIIALLVAYMLSCPQKQWWGKETRYLGISFLAAAGIFMLVSFRFLYNLPQFYTTLVKHIQYGAEGYKGLQMFPATGWQFYATVMGWGIGWPLTGLVIAGVILTFRRRYRPGMVPVIFSVVLFGYMGAQKIVFARFLLPILAPLVIVAMGELSRLVATRGSKRLFQSGFFWPVLVGMLLVQPLVSVIWFDHLLTLPDTRQIASNWISREFPADTVIVTESYSVLPNTVFADKQWPKKIIRLNERGPARNDSHFYVAQKTNLIVLSNFISARVRQNPAEEAARLAQQSVLNQKAQLLKVFNPYRSEKPPVWFYLDELYGPAGETLSRKQPGPLLKIYQLPYQNQPYHLDIPSISTVVRANFDNKVMLLGYDLPVRRANPGEAIPLTLYWQALSQMDETYVVFNHLLDANQHNWGGYDRWPQETANTNLWHPKEVVIDSFNLPVAIDAPAGIYTIDIGLYNQADRLAVPLPLLQGDISTGQNSVRFGQVKIGHPVPATPAKLAPSRSLDVRWGEPAMILLEGYDVTRLAQEIKLTLHWRSLDLTAINWSTFIHVRDSSNTLVAQHDGPLGGGRYPSSLWDTGEQIIDQASVWLPPLPAGNYKIVVGLYNLADGSRLPLTGLPDNEITLETIKIN